MLNSDHKSKSLYNSLNTYCETISLMNIILKIAENIDISSK